jgi:ATP-dependent protease ClpP protease subunit
MDLENFDLITDWKQRVDDSQKAYYALSVRHNKFHYWVGVLATILTTMASAALIVEVTNPGVRVTVGLLGVVAALLVAVQTFYSQAKRAEIYRCAVSQLSLARRDIEIFERFVPNRKSEREQRINAIDERISNIEVADITRQGTTETKTWPWILLLGASAVFVILLIALGREWINQIPATQQTEVYGIRESVQQGTASWEFDAEDPLIQQRVILINTFINELTTQKVITLLAYFNGRDNETPITIFLSSTGGYTKDAYAILQAMQESDSKVNTVAISDCFSAYIKILMGGTGERKIARNSRIMIHTHSYPYDDDPQSYSTILYERERDFFRENSEIPLDWIGREEKYYYLTPEQAITYQLADGILE